MLIKRLNMHIGLFIKDFAVGKKFSKDGLPTKSGAEFHGENHAKQLIKRGNEVTIFAKKKYWFTKARENLDGIDLVRLHAPFRWLEIILRLLTTHRDIDAFYIIGTPKFAVWAVLWAKLMNKPVTLALTGKAEIFEADANWRNKIFSKCTKYIALSHEIKDGFVKYSSISSDLITILTQGIDTKLYPILSKESKNELRKKNNFSPEDKIVMFCARLVPDKGIYTIIKLWPIVHLKHPTAKLLIVGGGEQRLVDDLNKMSCENDNTVYVLGEKDNPAQYYQMSDIFVFPSKHEGMPTVLLEAMSCGLAPVTSHIGGCEDVVKDNETGFMVEVDDHNSFAKYINYLIENEEERVRISKNAHNLVYDYCDYSNVIWKLEDIIKC